jgi:hypothetical protein
MNDFLTRVIEITSINKKSSVSTERSRKEKVDAFSNCIIIHSFPPLACLLTCCAYVVDPCKYQGKVSMKDHQNSQKFKNQT